MCPACLSTVALIAAGAGSAGGLAAVVVRKVRHRAAVRASGPEGAPPFANEEETR